MKFTSAIDAYIADAIAEGQINSPRTETSYRHALMRHAEDVGNRDPRTTNRDDVKRTLRRYPHPNTQRRNRSMLVSFYSVAGLGGVPRGQSGRTDAPAQGA